MNITTRAGSRADAPAIVAIYNEGIEDRVATFETRPRVVEDVAEWFDGKKVIIVAQVERDIVGAAWTSPTSGRSVYARNAEASVYVGRDARGRGVGRTLLRALIEETRRREMWKLVAGIFTENQASLALFASFGFRVVGRQEAHGQLDGVFRDVVLMERIVAPTVLFACVRNAGRSQIAAAWFNRLADPAKARAISAGTSPGSQVHPEVRATMNEAGIDLSSERPKVLSGELARAASMLITMGCGEECPVIPGLERNDWPLQDPSGQCVDRVREIRDEIRGRVHELLEARGWSAARG